MTFQLEIQHIENTCIFKLTWSKGQQISATVPYAETLSDLNRVWRKAYLGFYKKALRARVRKPKNDGGKIDLPQDLHRQLVQAEAELLAEFHRWLRQEELYEIRAKIAGECSENITPTTLFLTCSENLERLPWETWELGSEFGCSVAIARSPINITSSNQNTPRKFHKPRILVILGDDTGLDLQNDVIAINALKQIAEVTLFTWDSQQSSSEIKQQIQSILTDEKGWSILFFAGHSNETTNTGGELAIAPNIALSVSEIACELKIAQANGLQFALFNSCNGLSIAKSLIDLGLSQVAVMREPIHNRVAQVFLLHFLQALANYQNVHQALIKAGEHLKTKENLIYPSAYLIPSLFCHPDAQLYRLPDWGWRQQLKKWLPSRYEAIAAGALCLLSIMPPVQNYLLDKRTLVQSVYRDITEQLPSAKAPVTLIHIDEQSLRNAEIDSPVPMDRQYLASLIDRLVAGEAQIIGIDYLFDRTQPQHDPILARSVAKAVEQHQTWFIFGAYKQTNGQEVGVMPATNIANPNWTLQGYTDSLPNYMSLLPESANCTQACPFAYLLSMVQQVTQESSAFKPQIDRNTNLRDSVYDYIDPRQEDRFLSPTKLPALTTVVQYLGQQWLRPIQDFSIPPDLVYDRLPAWKLLELKELKNLELQQQIVIIGSGGYAAAGLTPGSDNLPTPNAIAYWNTRRGLKIEETPFTGSEMLAYTTHHWLHHRLVMPIPELWAVLTVLLIAKGIKLNLGDRLLATKWRLILLSSAVTLYGLIILQLYVSQAILLPWLLPSIAIATGLLKQSKTNN